MTFVLETTPAGVDLVITDRWTREAEASFRDNVADGLVLNYARGFKGRDLAFLRGLPVKRLSILARTLQDISGIYSVADTLKSLQVQADPRTIVELDRLPLIQTLSATWSQVRGSIAFAPNLEHLFVLGYDEQDFTPITHVESLISLRMKDYPSLMSLDGIEAFPRLIELGVFLARGLRDISALERASSNALQTLQLASCRGIDGLDPVGSCSSLRFLDVSECGDLPTLEPLRQLRNLEVLWMFGSTRIIDMDLSPIADLPKLEELRMQSRRGYSPPLAQVLQLIDQRNGHIEGQK